MSADCGCEKVYAVAAYDNQMKLCMDCTGVISFRIPSIDVLLGSGWVMLSGSSGFARPSFRYPRKTPVWDDTLIKTESE